MSFNDVLDRGEAQGHRRSHLGAVHSMTSKKKSQELRVGKFIRATWPKQRKAVERDERMETSFSRSSFLTVFLLLLTSPPPFSPSHQGKVRPSGVCSPIFPPSLITIWESTLLMDFPGVCVILAFVSFWICSFSSEVLCLCHGITWASKLTAHSRKHKNLN